MPPTEIRGNQIKDNSITGDDVDESTLILNTLKDADGDTKVQVEESADEDKIRFDIAGAEKVVLDATGLGIGTSSPASPLHVYGNLDGTYVATIDNDENTNGHVLKLSTDGNGSGSRLLEMEDGDGDIVFRARADGRFGFGPDGVSSMGAGTFVVGIDNSSHTADIAISQRLQHLGDSDTYIDFPSNDNMSFTAGGSTQLEISDTAIHVSQYIRHMGDTNTHINFTDDRIVLKAGNISMVKMEEKDSAPHEVTINDGSNNIDFVVKGNGSGGGNPGMKFDASTNRLGLNGVGTPDKALHVGGSMKLETSQPTIFFDDSGTAMAEIGINSSDNIVIENKTMNKHIVFKCNDQGVVREGLRLDGAVPEVVVNQQSESLVDFRVESDNNTHMLFVDGSADKIGVNTNAPVCELDVNGTVRTKAFGVDVRDVNSTSSVQATDYCLRCVQTGAITITLPAKAQSAGRVLVFKDALGNAASNNITIDGDSSDTIDGNLTFVLNQNKQSVTLVCDGINGWMVTDMYIP
tara:strand:- start:1369 stop:2931 length:1563 start_codon:yes stop_codon:yes gene_type:complete